MTCKTLQRPLSWASSPRATTSAAVGLNAPSGKRTGPEKNAAKLVITPTTAAVIAVSGALKRRSPRLVSTRGAPARINPKDGRNVNHTVTRVVARASAKLPPRISERGFP